MRLEIFELALKYFILNRRRTVRGAQIITIGLVVVASTNLLISGLSEELADLSQNIIGSNDNITIQPNGKEYFSKKNLADIIDYLDASSLVDNYLIERLTFGYIHHNINETLAPFHITNMTELIQKNLPKTLEPSKIVFITSNLARFLGISIGSLYSFNVSSITFTSTIIGTISDNENNINSGFYIDYRILNLDPLSFNNRIFIQLYNEKDSQEIINDLKNFEDVDVKPSRTEGEFLESSAKQISATLIILQTAISIIIFLSIWNIMNTIILESKYDIRILISLGYGRIQLWTLFISIAFLMGLLGAFLSIFISILLVTLILTYITVFLDLHFISIDMPFQMILILFFNGLLVSVISVLYPSYRGVMKR